MVLERIKELVKKITQEVGVELYDIEMKHTNKGKVLRVYLTRKDGVTLSDCTRVSRLMSQELDVIDLITSNYFLEVSSPGLERPLKTVSHYEQALDELIKVTYRQEEKNNTVRGILQDVSSDGIVLVKEAAGSKSKLRKEQANESSLSIPFDSIKKARTVYEFKGKAKE